MKKKYPLLTTLSSIGVLLLLLPNFLAGAAMAQPSSPTVISSGSKVLGTILVNGQNQTLSEQWKVTQQEASSQSGVNPDTVYYIYTYYNTMTLSCGVGTDYNTQKGQVTVEGAPGGPITSYYDPATTYQGYTGLGCDDNFAQSANTASLQTSYVYYYTTGIIQVCFLDVCDNINYYYQTMNAYNDGTATIDDWTAGI